MSQNETRESVETIALPCEIPKPIDISKLPLQVLRSGSIEALIAQNEDLMARLTVTLRRLALIEENIQRLQNENQKLEHENECLTDQCLIHQKKDEFWKEKVLKAESDTDKVKAELQLLEIRYAELYSTSDTNQSEQSKIIEDLNRRLRRHEKYRHHARQASRRLKQSYREIRKRWEEQQAQLENLKSRFEAMAAQIEFQNLQYQHTSAELTDSYEVRLAHLQNQLSEALEVQQNWQQKAVVFESLLQDQTQLENRAILAENRLQNLQNSLTDERDRLERQLAEALHNTTVNKVALMQTQDELKLTTEKLNAQTGELSQLREQVTSMQLLWDQSRKKVEQLTAQEAALQRLNQELSLKLNQSRQVQQTGQAQKEIAAIQAFKNGNLNDEQHSLTWLEKIEESLAEIETGFKSGNHPA